MQENRGFIVEKVIRREGHSLTNLARLTRVNRRSLYNWFLQPDLKSGIIIKIGQAIHHDFHRNFLMNLFQRILKLKFLKAIVLNRLISGKRNTWILWNDIVCF
jgi:hypothetical protein